MDQHLVNLREQMLQENEGDPLHAAAKLAWKLHGALGYSQGSATLSVLELFPEVTEDEIKEANGWEFP